MNLNNSKYVASFPERVTQGNIYRNIEVAHINTDGKSLISVPEKFLIVVSQDCDLDWDYQARKGGKDTSTNKYIRYILCCPLYLAEDLKRGTHLQHLNLTLPNFNSALWSPIKKNDSIRFHFLEAKQEMQIPELVGDFKYFFTIERNYFYEKYHNDNNYLSTLTVPYREDFCSRFSNFLSRIPLPEPYLSI